MKLNNMGAIKEIGRSGFVVLFSSFPKAKGYGPASPASKVSKRAFIYLMVDEQL